MKRSELIFSAVLVPVDAAMLVAAAAFAYYLRFSAISEVRPVLYELPVGEYFKLALLIVALWLVVFALSGLYRVRSTRRAVDEFTRIFFACSTGFMLIVLLVFFSRELFSSRFIIVSGWILAIIFVAFGRAIVRFVQRTMFRRGVGIHQVVLVGEDEATSQLLSELARHPESLGLKVVYRIPDGSPAAIAALTDQLALQKIDELILAAPSISREERQRLLEFSNDHHLIFRYAADLLDTRLTAIDIQTVAGIPLIEIRRTPLDGWGKILKRLFDIVLSTLLLLVLSPIMLLVAAAVRLDSEGPAIMQLNRVGERGRPFTMYKFRSMIKNAHQLKQSLAQFNERNDGPLFKMTKDPRITRVGRFIRKTSLDELPQFWNVLRGDMSLVGPRPHEPEEVAKYERHQRTLLTIKPGITGLAQISGRSDLRFDEEVRLDTFYIEHWSLSLDLQIIAKTPSAVFSTKAAT